MGCGASKTSIEKDTATSPEIVTETSERPVDKVGRLSVQGPISPAEQLEPLQQSVNLPISNTFQKSVLPNIPTSNQAADSELEEIFLAGTEDPAAISETISPTNRAMDMIQKEKQRDSNEELMNGILDEFASSQRSIPKSVYSVKNNDTWLPGSVPDEEAF